MQKLRKMLAMLLCFSMLFTGLPMTTFAVDRAKLELVMVIWDSTTSSYREMTQTEIEALDPDDASKNKFLVGVKMCNMDVIPGFKTEHPDYGDPDETGLFSMFLGVEYNDTYLTLEPADSRPTMAGANITTRTKLDPTSFYNQGDTYSCITATSRTSSNDGWKIAVVNVECGNAMTPPSYKGETDEYAAILEFQLKGRLASGGSILRMYDNDGSTEALAEMLGQVCSIGLGSGGINGGFYQADKTTDVTDIENHCDYAVNNANLSYLCPVPVVKPTLGGTVKILDASNDEITASNKPVYGDTIKANADALTADGAALPSGDTVKYQWKRGSDNIADATNATYTLTSADVGKVVSVDVSTAKTDGTVSATGQETQKKTLNAPTGSVGTFPSVKVGATSDLTKKLDYTFTSAEGLVGSDVVKSECSATYTDVSTVKSVTFNDVTMSATLTGADKDNYTFAGAANIQGVGSVIDKVITGIQVTTAPTKMSYASGETIDLTGMVVKVTYDNDSTDTATFTAANASFSTLPGEIKIKVAATGGDIQITGGTTATQAMNNLPLLAYTDSLTAGAATPTNLTISAATPKSLESISADPTNNFTAGAAIGDGNGKLTYAHDTALDLTGLKAKVKHSDNVEYEKTFAELTAMGIKVYVDGNELTGNITAAMDGKTVTLKDPSGTITGTLTVGTIKIGKTAPTVTFGNTNQTFGSTYTAVTATINNNTASTVDLSSSVKYVVPSYTTGAVDAVACNKTVQVACNHTTSDPGCAADCTYVAGTPCTETVACNHDTVQAADCPASGVICNAGDPTACLHDAAANCALYQARQSCTKTVACNHNTSDPGCAASCTYVAGTPCTKTVEVACNHNTSDPGCAPDCTYVAGSAGTAVPGTEVTAMTNPAMAAYLATLTTADCPVSITVKVAQTDFTGDNYYDALAADAIGTLTLSAPSTGGGGGGGGSSVSTYTVKFDAAKNGTFAKDAKTSVKVEKNSTLAKSDVPTVTAKEGYKFIGWSLDGKTVVDPTAEKVTKSVTYTALYKENLGDHTAYMNGNDKGEFKPDANITRAEAAALLARLVPAYDDNTTYTGTFSDVNAAAWYANEVFFDVKSGYITGYADGSFKPGNNITRQEFAIIVARYLGMENEGTSSFADCDGVYAEGYISQLVRDGIITGYVDGTFRPNAYITRAEAVKVLNGVFDRVPDKAVINEAIDKYDVKLVDVSKRHWAYYEILEAAIDHEISDFHA